MDKEELINRIDAWGCWIVPGNENERYITTRRAKILINKLDDHKQVELPKDVAEYLKDSKTGDMSILYALSGDDAEEDVRDWLQYDDNQETFVNAWLYGCKEKESLYVMPVPYATHNMYYAVIPSGTIGTIGSKIGATKFTEAEINEYFPKIKEFAERMEE